MSNEYQPLSTPAPSAPSFPNTTAAPIGNQTQAQYPGQQQQQQQQHGIANPQQPIYQSQATYAALPADNSNGSAPPQYHQQQPPMHQNQQQQYPGAPIAQPIVYGTNPNSVLVSHYQPSFVPPHFPCRCICPYCNSDIITRTDKEIGCLNWVGCGVLTMLGCILGCCLIPFAVDSWKDTNHFCPRCNNQIARAEQIKF